MSKDFLAYFFLDPEALPAKEDDFEADALPNNVYANESSWIMANKIRNPIVKWVT